MTSLRLTLCLLVVGIVAAFPSAAGAFTPVAPTYTQGQSLDTAPPGYTTTGHQAIAIANGTKTAADATRSRKGVKVAVFANKGHWEVDYYVPNKLISEVIVSSDGHVERSWTGLKARALWTRGHYGHLFDNPLVFLPFALLFLAPFFDRRRPLRMLHFDLLAMLSFGVSYAFFTHAYPEQAVWLAYPPLIYLMARMLWIGFGKGNKKAKGRLVPMLPTTVLVIGLVVLTGARIGLNIADNQVIDVGYASVVGADRIEHKLPLYVDNDQHGDTYGPVNYVAYVPFELIFPWHGKWDSLPSAHAASIFFDLMTILGLFLLGRRLRAGPEGKRLGLALAWGWAAYPFTLFALMENTNDALVAMLLVYTLLALTSPVARGGLLGLAAAAKFMPGALLPLIAFSGSGAGDRKSWRDAMKTVAVCCGVVAFSVLVYLPDGGLKEFWYCTLDFQLAPAAGLLGLGHRRRHRLDTKGAARRRAAAVAGRRRLPAQADAAAGRGARRRGVDRAADPGGTLVLLLHPVVRPRRPRRIVRPAAGIRLGAGRTPACGGRTRLPDAPLRARSRRRVGAISRPRPITRPHRRM